MSKYTTELRYLIENNFDLNLKDYPIFDENYRETLNKKIISHYYFREIGFETAELFKVYLNTKMSEIMPYYNKLYKSELIEFNPLENVKQTETFIASFAGNTATNSNLTANSETINNSDSMTVSSDTPQGFLNNGSIAGDTWATNAEKASGNVDELNDTYTSSDSNTNVKNNQDYTKEITGKTPGESFSEMLQKYRDTFLNIDMMIINELSDLFMNIY